MQGNSFCRELRIFDDMASAARFKLRNAEQVCRGTPVWIARFAAREGWQWRRNLEVR